jgi:molybdenum cofactor cytidylyltransferase
MCDSMTDQSPVAAVILAAGLGRRFGFPKVAARLGGETLLSRVARLARTAGLSPIVAVVPLGAETPARVEVVVNHDPARGLSTSLKLGIAATPADRAALVLLVDQPTMEPETIATVLAARGPKPLVAAWADGRYGPPVLIEAEVFPLVMDLTGDIGLREILGERPDLVETVLVGAHAPDVDTEADLDRLEARLEP